MKKNIWVKQCNKAVLSVITFYVVMFRYKLLDFFINSKRPIPGPELAAIDVIND